MTVPLDVVDDLRAAGITLGRLVGAGATGLVFRAAGPAGEVFAVKVPRHHGPAEHDALEREALALQRLRAVRGIVQLVRVVRGGTGAQPSALVLHPCAPETLADLLTTTSLAPPRARQLLAEVAGALDAAHEAGVVHGDVSAANVVVHDGHALLVDFTTATVDGVADPCIRGTLPFAAPEVLRGQVPTAAADLFALGVLATELGVSRAGAADPAELDALTRASLDPDPRRRPAAAAWLDALGAPRRFVTGPAARPTPRPIPRTQEFGPRPPARPDPAAPPAGRRVAAVTGVVGALVLALVLGVVVAPRVRADAREPAGEPAGGPAAAGPGTATCPPLPDPPLPDLPPSDAASAERIDLDGAGCLVEVRWDPAAAVASVYRPDGPRRYRMGEPGDQLLVGRWSCGPAAAPALYRPGTGAVFVFAGWAKAGHPLPEAQVRAGPRDGRARVAHDGACDRVEVDPEPSAQASTRRASTAGSSSPTVKGRSRHANRWVPGPTR